MNGKWQSDLRTSYLFPRMHTQRSGENPPLRNTACTSLLNPFEMECVVQKCGVTVETSAVSYSLYWSSCLGFVMNLAPWKSSKGKCQVEKTSNSELEDLGG